MTLPVLNKNEPKNRVPDDVRRIFRLLVNLGHFNYSMVQMRNEDDLDASQAPPLGLFTDAVFLKIADWFSKPNGNVAQIEIALSNLSLPELWLDNINEALDSSIGSITWRQLAKDYRNEAISHNTFDSDILDLIYEKRQIDRGTWNQDFEAFIDELAPAMKVLQVQVEDVFQERQPEMFQELRNSGRIYLVGE